MKSQELSEMVEAAQEKIQESIEILQQVIDETGDINRQAYILDKLKIVASSDHGFMTCDPNLSDWIYALENGDDD